MPPTPERRLEELGIILPAPPSPFGTYVEAVQSGRMLFLTGMLPTEGQVARFVGRLGDELHTDAGRAAARAAALNALAVARKHLGTLDRVTRMVRLGVYIAIDALFDELPRVADGASELFVDVFGPEKSSSRLVIGVAALPLHVPIELEVILEVA